MIPLVPLRGMFTLTMWDQEVACPGENCWILQWGGHTAQFTLKFQNV